MNPRKDMITKDEKGFMNSECLNFLLCENEEKHLVNARGDEIALEMGTLKIVIWKINCLRITWSC